MNESRSILCAVADDDCREHVVALGADLAGITALPLVFTHVAEVEMPTPAATVVPGGGGLGWAPFPEGDYRRAQQRAIERGADFLAGLGVPDEAARVRAGHAAAEIEQVADEVNAEVIIVGSHPRGALRAAAADSVTRSLAAGGSRPVLCARPEGDVLRSTGPVVCGVDEGDDAERVAAVAARFASRLDRPLRLVHVGSDVGPLGAARGRRPDGVAVETALVGPGDVAERLRDHADASEAALIVVGCRGHGALRSMFGGSVSLELTNEAIQPVLVVPPRAR